ncbi:MAG: SCP2 sterol-binding domain-containing protein [Pseudomonadota bacterium]
MGELINGAIAALEARLPGGFDGVACFIIENEGAIMVDNDGIREGEAPADVTLTASVEVFRQIIEGDLDPTSAFMKGDLKIDGDMGTAMRLGSAMA